MGTETKIPVVNKTKTKKVHVRLGKGGDSKAPGWAVERETTTIIDDEWDTEDEEITEGRETKQCLAEMLSQYDKLERKVICKIADHIYKANQWKEKL